MKKVLSIILTVIFLAAGSVSASAAVTIENSDTFPSVSAEAVYITDVGSDTASDADDTILYTKNINQKMYPASLVKIMTAVVIFEKLSSDEINNKTAVMTQDIINEIYTAKASNAGLKLGEVMSLKELLYCMLLPSGADAAMLLSKYCGDGSISSFVAKMNEKCAALGMTGTHFTNVTGLHDDNEYTTAADLKLLTEYALFKMPNNDIFREIVASPSFTLSKTNMQESRIIYSTNNLVRSSNYTINGVVGVKTGTTTPAGQCLISYYEKDGYHLITITLKSSAEITSFKDQNLIYKWILGTFSFAEVSSLTFDELTVNVKRAAKPVTTTLSIKSTQRLLFPTDKLSSLTLSVGDGKTLDSIKAPVKFNQIIMPAQIMYNGQAIADVQLASNESIAMGLQYYLLYSLQIIIPLIILIIAILIIVKVKKSKSRRRRRK